jgi:hypothetical protein
VDWTLAPQVKNGVLVSLSLRPLRNYPQDLDGVEEVDLFNFLMKIIVKMKVYRSRSWAPMEAKRAPMEADGHPWRAKGTQ